MKTVERRMGISRFRPGEMFVPVDLLWSSDDPFFVSLVDGDTTIRLERWWLDSGRVKPSPCCEAPLRVFRWELDSRYMWIDDRRAEQRVMYLPAIWEISLFLEETYRVVPAGTEWAAPALADPGVWLSDDALSAWLAGSTS